MRFGVEKLDCMVWLSGGEINLKICLFVLTECTNVTDGPKDGQTPHDAQQNLTTSAVDVQRAADISRLNIRAYWRNVAHCRLPSV